MQRSLQAELVANTPLVPGYGDDIVSHLTSANVVAEYEDIKNPPYLNACIKEVMHIHSTVGFGLPRVVPPGKTFVFEGHIFKEGSVVSVPSFTTNRSRVGGEDPT